KAGALLHDIGKIAVPDYILNKPGRLTAAEFEKMKYHTIAGAQILSRVEFPYPVVPVVRHHHERWDGGGYPDGLKGEEIPLTARILSVVDCFDAVREDRQYRCKMSREEAIGLILRGSGTQYDPRVVGTFIAHLPEFEEAIRAHRGAPIPTFGIEPAEQLSEAARRVPPATGLAEDSVSDQPIEETLVRDETRSLVRLARSLLAAGSQSALLSAFTDKLHSMVPFDLCGITLVVPGTGNTVVAHAAGRYAELFKGRHIGLGQGVTGWAIANHKVFCNVDPRLDLPLPIAGLLSDCRTMAVFPIIEDGLVYGAVSLYSSALAEYTDEHQRALGEAVAMIASALRALSPLTRPEFESRQADDDRRPETVMIA
ncbi:MAG: HD domain-containing protein, partial [Blastocatellia bacterium]|nr:HD domain-containing protein [Blastocatellia bacterium]